MKNSNKKSFLSKGSVAKRLALMTLFGVGFVLPAMNNIALANYGGYSAGGIKADGATGLLTGCDTKGATQSLTISDFTTSSDNSYWAKNKTTAYGGNYVVLKGSDNNNYTFKVVEYSSSNSTSGVVTLWNYGWNGSDGTGSVNGRFTHTTFGANATYSTSKLREFMTGSVASILSNYTGAMVAYTASGAAAGESINGAAANGDLIWAASSSEVKNSGMWGLSSNIQRADGDYAWLRSYYDGADIAYRVYYTGFIYYGSVSSNYRVRPALQLKIASVNPAAFTSNGNIVTTGILTENPTSGTVTEYAPDTGATAPTIGTSVTLDGTTISGFASGGSYNLAGMLTTDTTNSTWENLSTKITHMAQADSGALNFSNVATGTDYVLRAFGLDGTNKKVTELSGGAIAGLSKGADGKIHMKVKDGTTDGINNGVAVTLKNGAVVDLAGDASNPVTVQETSDTGKLNLGASNYEYSGNITDNGILTVEGTGTLVGTVSGTGKVVVDGTVSADADKFTQTGGLEVANTRTLTFTGDNKVLGQTVSGDGKVVVDGTVSADADKFTQTGGLEVKDADDVLTLTAGILSKAVTNNGTVKLNGATLGGAHVTTGTLEFAKDVSLNADYVAADTNKVDSGVTLTLTGAYKTLAQTVSGDGKVVVDGTISADAGKFTQTGGLEVKDTLAFTSRGLDVAAVGGFTQAEDSNVVVPVTVIESEANTAENALFGNITAANQLDVKDGNLIVLGQVTDGQYYVLAEGTAVADGTVKAANLWKKENIALDTSKYFLADYDYVTNGNAIAVKVQAATKEEVNTSGLAAVQQGNMAVAKEFTGEVENHLGMIANPKLTEKEKYNKEVWANYIRTKETTEGMKLEGLEGNNTAQYNGAVVGVDFYSSKKAVTGVAFSYTTGDIDSYSNATSTRNKSKYYGVSFYDRVTNGNTALIYDIGYIKGDNDISQFYTGQEITADVKTDTYTAGVRYEAEFGTEKSRVVPFASFRYMRQNNKDYTNSHNTRFEAKNQNLYIPKVGIAWTGDFAMPQSEWTWRPSVEVGYLWNLGDRSAESNVLVGARMGDVGYDIADRSSYYAKAGMEFMSRNFTAGVFYRYLKGNAVRNNKWNVNMSWKF